MQPKNITRQPTKHDTSYVPEIGIRAELGIPLEEVNATGASHNEADTRFTVA